MKKYLFNSLLLGLLIFGGFYVNAQSLEFNQVRYIEYDLTIPSGTFFNTVGSSTLIVPAGKVLKITSVTSGYTVSSISRPLNGIEQFEIYLNGKTIHHPEPASTSYPSINFPIWLPAGSYNMQYYYDSGSSSSFTYVIKWGISAIEFNVVP